MKINSTQISYIKSDEFLSYLDWLTRFKNPINNILRVSEKILLKHSVEPKLNSQKIEAMSFFTRINIAQYIWNKSIENLLMNQSKEHNLKDFLIYEEEQTFNTNNLIEQVTSLEFETATSELSYKELREKTFFAIDDLVLYFQSIQEKPDFLNRLISKKTSKLSTQELFEEQNAYASIKKLFLVEGITEETILPVFANKLGINLKHSGIKIKASGGKTSILKYYTQIRKLLKIPVYILLDADGVDVIDDIKNILEEKDKIYLIPKGEIEDILSHQLIVKALNNYFYIQGSISESDLQKPQPMTKILHELFREKGFGEFQKAKFAQILKENITQKEDCSEEIIKIFDFIRNK